MISNVQAIPDSSVYNSEFAWITIENDSSITQINVCVINIGEPMSASGSKNISASVTGVSLLDFPQTPLSAVLAEIATISDAANLLEVLNYPKPFETHLSREEISQKKICKRCMKNLAAIMQCSTKTVTIQSKIKITTLGD